MPLEPPPALKCPQCGSTDKFSTVERVFGIAGVSGISESGLDHNGEFNLDPHSSESIGIICACGWKMRHPDWWEILIRHNKKGGA